MVVRSAFLALILLAMPALAHAQTRTEVAIREGDLSDQTRRYVVSIKVGGTPIDAGLDSGSTGIRILPSVLQPADAEATTKADSYSYGSGAEYVGVVGNAKVMIGEASGQVPVQLIRSVGCIARMPKCPVSRVPLAKYGIQGDGLAGEGFK